MFQKQCFYLSTTRLNWTLSQNNCSNSGGSLAVIDSKEVQVAVTLCSTLYFSGYNRNTDLKYLVSICRSF